MRAPACRAQKVRRAAGRGGEGARRDLVAQRGGVAAGGDEGGERGARDGRRGQPEKRQRVCERRRELPHRVRVRRRDRAERPQVRPLPARRRAASATGRRARL